jgi:hypothetical protein
MFLLTPRLRFGGGNLAVASPDSPLSYDQDGFRLAEILVGAVVVGVIIVAPEAAPAVLRLAW